MIKVVLVDESVFNVDGDCCLTKEFSFEFYDNNQETKLICEFPSAMVKMIVYDTGLIKEIKKSEKSIETSNRLQKISE